MSLYSVAIPNDVNQRLLNHLIRDDEQEDLCFATYNPSTGIKRFTGIISDVILPLKGERQVHGNVSFNPSYFERVLKIAQNEGKGIVFLHSHPFPGWQFMSYDDTVAEDRMSKAAFAITGLPLLGMTAGIDGAWSARFWIKDVGAKRKYDKMECETVRVVGKQLSITFNPHTFSSNSNKKYQERTISAWGKSKQDDISRLKVCIVGAGSVGSIVAETLARTGFSYIKLIDFDIVKGVNLDRTLHATSDDIGEPKVNIVALKIVKSATSRNFKVIPINSSICDEKIIREAIDCDVIFSCVDRPWPRQILNYIAYTHLIPVIDGGIKVRTNGDNSKLLGAEWRAHTAGNERACIECVGQYSQYQVGLEKEGFFEIPEYIEGAPELKNIVSSQNVFPFSVNVASLEVLQLLNLFIAPCGIPDVGQQLYHFVTGTLDKSHLQCKDNCFFQSIIGKGDNSGINPV